MTILCQSGSEDDDEAWLTELTGSKVTTSTGVVSESDPPAELCLNSAEALCQHLRTPSIAEPNLPRTLDPALSNHARKRDLPGPVVNGEKMKGRETKKTGIKMNPRFGRESIKLLEKISIDLKQNLLMQKCALLARENKFTFMKRQ